ncbi:MAG: FlgD immunoglobulin-like domain containing protein [Candidatus Eisenbacteria bacterium]
MRAALPVLVSVLACFGIVLPVALPNPASAGCIDYRDYMRWAGGLSLPVYAQGLSISGDYAYVAGVGPSPWRGSLQVIDISDPLDLRIVAQLETPGSAEGSAEDVAISGSLAVVADGAAGLQMVDISDPSTPRLIGSVATPFAWDVEIQGDYAYTVGHQGGMTIVDIHDPAHPQVVENIALWPYTLKRLVVSGERAYIVPSTGGGGLLIVDISDPHEPFLAGRLETPYHWWSVSVSGDYAYIGTYGTIDVVDVSDPSDPRIVGEISDLPDYVYDLLVAGGKLYAAGRSGGLLVADLTDPTNPVLDGGLASVLGLRVALSGSRAYVLQVYRLDAIDVTSTQGVEMIGRTLTHGWGQGVSVCGAYACVAEEEDGLDVVDVSDPAHPELVGSVDTPGLAHSVSCSGSYAYVADGNPGLQVVDLGNPQSPELIANLDLVDAVCAAYGGGHVYVAEREGRLDIVDVRNPIAPRLAAYTSGWAGATMALAVAGNHACVLARIGNWPISHGLLVVIDAASRQPRILGQLELPGGNPTGVAVSAGGRYVFVSDDNVGIHVVDLVDPTAPQVVESFTTDCAMSVTIDGPVVYVGDSANGWQHGHGLQVLDATDPTDLRILGSAAMPGEPRGMAVMGEYLCVASDWTLQILPAQCLPLDGATATHAGVGVRTLLASAGGGGTAIRLDVNGGAIVIASATVFDVSGRRVRTLLDGPGNDGAREVLWDGRDDTGRRVAPGVYMARVTPVAGRSEQAQAQVQAQTVRIVMLP